MAGQVTFELDTRDVERRLLEIGKRVPVVIAQTLNRTGNKVRTMMKREIARDLGVPVGAVDSRMSTHNASPGEPRFQLLIKKRRIGLIDLGARGPEPSRGKGRGVSYRLGGTRRVPDAFIATMATGHRGVFRRSTATALRRGPAPHRSWLPIRELFGPSVAHVFLKHIDKARKLAQEDLVKELRRRLFTRGAI